MRTTPLSSLVGGIGALVFGVLCKYRVLPFLHADTIVSGGRPIPTADFAAYLSKMFFLFSAFAIALAVLLFFAHRGKGNSMK